MKIGFLGIGQCGSNICEVAENNNYTTAIINTSPEDLLSIISIRDTYKLLVGEQGGCGKERNIAKDNVKNYYKDIIDFVDNSFNDKEIKIVYVVFSAGGGTGSGMSPMIIDVLNNSLKHIKFNAILVLPSFNESPIALVNSKNCIKELYSLNITTLLVDNNFDNGSYTKQKLFSYINENIINSFNIILKINREPSKLGNLDQKDLYKTLTTPGNMIISEATFETKSVQNIENLTKIINSSWDQNIYYNISYDKVIKRIGFIMEIEDEVTQFINYDSITKDIGEVPEILEGYYKPELTYNRIITILTGLSFPDSYVNKIDNIMENKKENFKINQESDIYNKREKDWTIDLFEDNSNEIIKDKEADNISFEDIFSKY